MYLMLKNVSPSNYAVILEWVKQYVNCTGRTAFVGCLGEN